MSAPAPVDHRTPTKGAVRVNPPGSSIASRILQSPLQSILNGNLPSDTYITAVAGETVAVSFRITSRTHNLSTLLANNRQRIEAAVTKAFDELLRSSRDKYVLDIRRGSIVIRFVATMTRQIRANISRISRRVRRVIAEIMTDYWPLVVIGAVLIVIAMAVHVSPAVLPAIGAFIAIMKFFKIENYDDLSKLIWRVIGNGGPPPAFDF
jgi:hypothetical protein